MGIVINLLKREIKMRNDGLTKQEGKDMDSLIIAWNNFIKLEIQHPSDNQ